LALLAGLVLILAAAVPLSAPRAADALAVEPLSLEGKSGEHKLQVEIADTDAARRSGLMFRKSLASDRGMLFLYEGEQPLSMWMRNTYIPLDMVFIRADGRIRKIVRNTEPFSEEIISSDGPVSAVLEIAAGEADRMGLEEGDEVRHRRFGNGP